MTATTAKRKTDSTLGALVAHPLRCKLWTRFAERTASSSDIARELGLCVSNVSYHVRSLVDAGVIEAVGSRPVRGSVETFYRAVQPPHFSSEEFAA